METSPSGLNIELFEKELLAIKYVKNVHDFHIWSLSYGKPGK